MSSIDEKIRAGLKMLSPEKVAELLPHERIGLVMYFARERLSPAQIAQYVDLPESQVKNILEGRE